MDRSALLRTVDEAFREDFLLEVSYVTKQGVFSRRVMEPISIVHDYAHRKHTLWAHCLEHNRLEPRRLSGIESLRVVTVHTGEEKRPRKAFKRI